MFMTFSSQIQSKCHTMNLTSFSLEILGFDVYFYKELLFIF